MSAPERVLRHCGVLQIEPTDFCNLTCPMCHPQQGFRPTLHGDLLKGYMDTSLFKKIIDGIERSNVCFDHLIFQWLGDPSLHPELFELLDYARSRVSDRFEYFRIDTNAILLTPDRTDQLIAAWQRDPYTPVLVVFSLDAITRETYRKAKGRDYFDTVMDNIHYFLEARGRLTEEVITLNAEFQFVLQSMNAHEAKDFVDYWDSKCAEGRNGIGYNDIMLKRVSVGTGGEKQQSSDKLYADTIREGGLAPFKKDHIELKIWMERAWQEHDDPNSEANDLALGETAMANPSLVEARP